MPVAEVGSFPYNLVLFLHLVTVIVGFGGIVFAGVYVRKALQAGSSAAAISTTSFEVNKMAEYAIYAVPVFGILLIVLSNKAWEFSQGWVSASFLLYFIGVGVAHALIIPTHRKLNVVLHDGGTSAPDVAPLVKKLTLGGAINEVLLAVILILMVWKPGS